MRVPISWLKQYVPVGVSSKELAYRLTMAGIEVGEIDETGGEWDRDNVIVGHVLKVDSHPNADRLTLPTVDIGNGETATVVCGAPNVAAGQKIAFAREGARLFSPRSGKVETLKAANIRGVESAGMVCSSLELQLGKDHDGILVLDDDAPIGMPLVDYLGDAVLDIEVTPNRPDCLSVLGVAHEVAALTGGAVTEPDLSYPEEGLEIDGQVKIEIANPELCYRYTASLITGIKMGPSPQWMQDALVKAGQRPIINVVDITNYVMLEYGQPLHAFDFDAVKDRTIIVRAARQGEEHVTLDGEKRVLSPPMLVIADSTDAVGLAGVMGGANAEMHDGTTSVLLESANFDPVNTRRTAGALRLRTDASYRFERGIRAELAPRALRRATKLILEIAGGRAAQGIIDLYPGRREPRPVKISCARLKQVLGVDFTMSRVESVLSSLGFERAKEPEGIIDLIEAVEAAPAPERDSTLWMTAPYWRSDISIEDDLVEEVARVVGYDSIPETMLATSIPPRGEPSLRTFRETLKDLLASAGMQETISYSLTSLESLGKVDATASGPEPLKLANPMSVELAYLRTTLRASILETMERNRRVSRGEGLRLFEVGRVYLAKEEARERELPDEREMAVGALSGPRFQSSWHAPRVNMDFFDAKGVLETVFAKIGGHVEYEPVRDPILHPGKAARMVCGDAAVGVVGEVHPAVLERFGLEGAPVVLFELDVEALRQAIPQDGRRYRSASRFPVSQRDLALVVDTGVPSAKVQSIIDRHKLVVGSTPFDVYQGEGIGHGKKSVAYRVAFQSDRDTLTSEQVDRAQGDIMRQLRREVGAELRDLHG